MEKILTICIPTYNRENVLIPDIQSYLSVDDNRFCIKINDNSSTDRTVQSLGAIHDPRLEYNSNESNVGSVPNWFKALSGCHSMYILFLLDKDQLRAEYLVPFLDYLENERPNFGYINFQEVEDSSPSFFGKGKDSIIAMSFLDKHPSGYFYDRRVFESATSSSAFKELEKDFIFPFEVLNAVIGACHSSVIVNIPLVRPANKRENKDGRSLTFDESNIWFGLSKRKQEFIHYLNTVLSLTLPDDEKYTICKSIYNRMMINVSSLYRNFLNNDDVCYHYYLHKRAVSRIEMLENTLKITGLYIHRMRGFLPGQVLACQVFHVQFRTFIAIVLS